MSAELLRRAAKVLRESAAKTTPEWRHEDGRIRTPEMPHLMKVRGTDPALAIYRRTEDAEYSVLMHPPVALALADWLNAQAAAIKDYADTFVEGKERPDDLTETDEAAVALARSILREDS